MNNIVFNTAASELQTTVSQITAPVTIGNSSLTVAGTVTVGNSVTIANSSLTVAGTVTVSQITDPVTIGNSSLTVAGTVTVGNSITIANATITTIISGHTFTSATVTLSGVSGTGVVFDDTDISQIRTASMFVDNTTGTNPITVSLQISPDGTLYIDDPLYTNQVILASGKAVIAIGKFAHYARLQYNLGTFTGTFDCYYNGQA